MNGNWNFPTPIRFGVGRIRELPEAARELGMRRPLLVTDPGLARLPLVADAVAVCAEADLPVAVFSDIAPNPTGGDVVAGVEAYRAHGCDGIVAFGGGAALDTGKAVGLMVGQTRPLWDFEDVGDWYTRVDVSGMAPVVAVPTTSGTGSEVGRASVIVDPEARKKKIIFHPRMLPGRVVADPELTVGLPAGITAAVGMDALSHNLEAFCASGFHPLADGIAMRGVELVARALVPAVQDGADLQARSAMMAASLMGAVAFQKGLGAMHAMSHPIGAVLDAHHGLINAIVMPYVLRHNESAIADRVGDLARLLGLDGFGGFLDQVLSWREELGIPHTLDAVGVTDALIPELAQMAAVDPSGATNPIPLDVPALERLFAAAVRGLL